MAPDGAAAVYKPSGVLGPRTLLMKISTQNEGGVSITVQVDILIAVLLCVAGLVIGGGAAGFIAFRMGEVQKLQMNLRKDLE